jgi:hypothetical protein
MFPSYVQERKKAWRLEGTLKEEKGISMGNGGEYDQSTLLTYEHVIVKPTIL